MAENKNSLTNNETAKTKKSDWQQKVISAAIIVFVIVITVLLFMFRDKVSELGNYGYLGAFIISLVANATVILPMPGLAILIGLGASFNPILIALFGAIGGAIGELSGYIIGRSGRVITSENKWYRRAEKWMQQKRGFLTLFLFALLPFLPLDVAGLVAGVSRYPIWKFFLACTLGKVILYVIMIYTGDWAWDWFNHLIA